MKNLKGFHIICLYAIDSDIGLCYNTEKSNNRGMKMEILAERIRQLRKSLNLSQAKVAMMAGTQQTSINRYESNQYDPPLNILIWYADYFDVSLDYLCGRTDKPQGKLYEYEPKALKVKEENKEDMEQFIDMCFDPSSPAGVKMKEAMMKLLIEKEDK